MAFAVTTCPTCAHYFKQIAVELVVFAAGAEKFSMSVIRTGLKKRPPD